MGIVSFKKIDGDVAAEKIAETELRDCFFQYLMGVVKQEEWLNPDKEWFRRNALVFVSHEIALYDDDAIVRGIADAPDVPSSPEYGGNGDGVQFVHFEAFFYPKFPSPNDTLNKASAKIIARMYNMISLKSKKKALP